jgi:ketosteroid isomerase-like protein
VNAFDELVDDALALVWQTQPVTASFAGELAFDALLPDVAADAIAKERVQLATLAQRLDRIAVPETLGARLDARFMRTYALQAEAERTARPRFHNPAWYTGEAAFGIIALLLRPPDLRDDDALAARIGGIPDFFARGRAHLAGRPLPAAWVERARTEALALARLLRVALPLHPWASHSDPLEIEAGIEAAERFAAALAAREDADPACGEPYLAALMQGVHGLRETPASLERRAADAFAASLAALEKSAARLDPTRSWREQLAALAEIRPSAERTLETYAAWNARTNDAARALVTPETDYALTFEPLPRWARTVAADLYFLFYRSPAARVPGTGSTYWVDGEPSVATIKLVHAVHHGSIGHHTQNARARAAASRFARIAGTDGASGLALLSAGTLVEGWACYAEDLMAEIPEFYTPSERLQLGYFELRNIACCLADVRLHAGIWSLSEMQRFYRDEAGFTPARIVSETTRNSIFPGSRLMYWTGTTQIAALRARSQLPARAFFDRLLSLGSAPVAWLAEELAP